jgi:hypothetical protein
MKRTLILSGAIALCLLGLTSASDAQVFIRAPFVRIAVGDGVAVRAPFVNLFVPPSGPVYGPYYYPQPIYGPFYQQPTIVGSPTAPVQPSVPYVPMPPATNDNAPPQPIQTAQAPTLDAFAKTFQAKAGSYEVTVLNPISKQPTNVRFALPEGTPRRVITTRDSIEFVYGLRQWVRIEFDKDGAIVTSR